jgi:hypothetical protein
MTSLVRSGAAAARRAHNPTVAGSSPASATNLVRLRTLPEGARFMTSLTRVQGVVVAPPTLQTGGSYSGVPVWLGPQGRDQHLHPEVLVERLS